jgi:hypothetical protein
MTDKKQQDSIGYFNYLGTMVKNGEKCRPTCETESVITKAKAAFNKEKTRFARKLDLI